MEPRYCGACGAPHAPNASACAKCGNRLDVEPIHAEVPSTRQRAPRLRRVVSALVDLVAVLGFAAIAVGAVNVYENPGQPASTPLAYQGPSTGRYETLIALALSDYSTNNAGADSAPKQQVVNGWVAKDLLSILGEEGADLLAALRALGDQNEAIARSTPPPDDRLPAFALLGVFAICWLGATAALRARFAYRPASSV